MGRSGTMLPVALAVLSGCALPGCLALQKTGADAIEMLQKTDIGYSTRSINAPPQARLLSWWTEGSRSEWLTLYDIQMSRNATAIVTHAGKNNQEFIDHAVMLGVSLKRHMPGYPMIALGVKGMTDAHQTVLAEAGWHVVLVADWRFPEEMGPACNASCIDSGFASKHQDSLERLNMFRLPIGRVLYLDADTYVTSGDLDSLLNGTDTDLVPEGNIGMVPNGCKRGYSAGVMLFKPSLEVFQEMLSKAAEVMSGNTTKKTEEQIINALYENNVTALDKKYNCMDPFGLDGPDKCQARCTEVVVSHFFGDPKPALADDTFLNFVRRPSGPFEQCSHMNHGSCNAWPNFYCDLVDNLAMLSRPLQQSIRRLGGCCHTPARESDPEDCHSVQEVCPESVSFNNFYKRNRSVNMEKQAPCFGSYAKTTLTPDPIFNGGRPIYAGPNNYYLFYGLEAKAWMVGSNYQNATSDFYAHDNHMPTKCPDNTKGWTIDKPGFEFKISKESVTFVTEGDKSLNEVAQLARRERRFALLKREHLLAKTRKEYFEKLKKQKHKRHRHRKHTTDTMQDNTTTDEATSEDNTTADETTPEDNITADETATEDNTTGEMPKELEEVKGPPRRSFMQEKAQLTTADQTAVEAAHAEDMKQLADKLDRIKEVRLRRSMRNKVMLEDAISSLPDVPNLAEERAALQKKLDKVLAHM